MKRMKNDGALAQFRRSKEARVGLLFALPAILGFLIFTIGPMIASLVLSFANYTGVGAVNFIGTGNYRELFTTDPFFLNSLKVTGIYVSMSIPLNITVSFFIAYLLSKNIRFRGLFRLIYYVPTVVPLVATAIIFMWLLNPIFGVANFVLKSLGLSAMKFLQNEQTVLPTMAVMGVWNTGATMLIFLAGLQSVPAQLYEAVDIDGGNGWHRFIHITIPMMTSALFFNLVMGCINGFQIFTQAYIITAGGPNYRSNFLVLQLFREAFEFSRMGKASAIAWIMFVIVLSLTIINFSLSNKWVYYEGGDER